MKTKTRRPIPVYGGDGQVAFEILEDGSAIHSPGKRVVPVDTAFLERVKAVTGLAGETITYFRVGGIGGDLVRFIDQSPRDESGALVRHGPTWWDVAEIGSAHPDEEEY